MEFVLCHGLRWLPSSSLKALFHKQLWRADGYYCAVHIEAGSPLEYSSNPKQARLLLVENGWSKDQARLDVISIALPWLQRRQLGEDVRVQTGKPPNTIVFHIGALCTFWKARNSGPRAYDGGYRRCTHWNLPQHSFTTLEELRRMPVFVPGEQRKRLRLGELSAESALTQVNLCQCHRTDESLSFFATAC